MDSVSGDGNSKKESIWNARNKKHSNINEEYFGGLISREVDMAERIITELEDITIKNK